MAAFFDRFASACTTWQPDPTAVEALESARAAAASAVAAAVADPASGKAAGQGSVGRRAQMRLVLGCGGGYPRALLAALVEGLERAPRALSAGAASAAAGSSEETAPAVGEPPSAEVPAPLEHAAASKATPGAASPMDQKDGALVHAAGLPLLRALRVLQRSAHNRAVLSSLGLLPTLCQLVRELSQKLQAVAGMLALFGGHADATRSGSTNGGGGAEAAAAPVGQLRLLHPLLVLLCEALLACQEFAEAEAAHHRRAALPASKQPGSGAGGHAARASAAQAASASGRAVATSRTAIAVAPLLERGMPALCCELLPTAQRIQLHSGGSGAGSRSAQRGCATAAPSVAGATEMEQRALLCLLALQAASPAAAAAALVQQGGGQGLATLVSLLGWPLASSEHQLPLSTAAASSSANLAGAVAPAAAAVLQEGQQAQQAQQQQQQFAAQPDGQALRSRHVRIASGSGLRPAAAELQLQLLALRAVGAAARSGGSAALRLLQLHACFLRLVQLLQWAALTFDAAGPLTAGPASAAPAEAQQAQHAQQGMGGGLQEGLELQRLFQAVWAWVGGAGSSGTAKALLPPLLGAILAAFRPAGAAGADRPDSGRGSEGGGATFGGTPPLELLQGSELEFHEAAVTALCGGGACGWHLQQQALLFAARMLGREQRMLPLLPPACQQLYERQQQAALASGSSVQASGGEALANLAALRAAGACRLVLLGPWIC